MPSHDTIYRFGPYELRTRAHELLKLGFKLKLRPQPYEVLKALVERPGDVVTREELRQFLWSTDTFVDFEQGLNTAIKELRATLNDSADEPRYIETLPKVGYRIIVPVESGFPLSPEHPPAEPEAASAENVPGAEESPSLLPHEPARRRWPLSAAIAIVLIIALGAYVQWSRYRARRQPPSARVMLAVLPFENLTGDPGQDYFSDGLTEEVIAQAGRIDPAHLGVIARTSVMHYKHTQESLDQIAGELRVQYVLEGSVRRDSNNVRISAQLIQMKDQAHLWSRQYDRQLSRLLTLQDEIARDAAEEIQLALSGRKRPETVRPASPSATTSAGYDLYLKGLYFWNKRTDEGFQRAVSCFEQAIAADPNYAPAHAGLANAYSLLTGYSRIPAAQLMPKARSAALRALELDANLPEAHTALALAVQNYDYDWQTAEKEYRRAIELNPNYATAHHWYAEHLGFRGRFDEAFRESARARQLDPLSLIVATDEGVLRYYARQYDRAIEQLRGVLELDPSFARAHLVQLAYVQKGMFTEALADLDLTRRIWGEGVWYPAAEAFIRGRAGQREQAQRALKTLEDSNRRKQVALPLLVLAYCGVGDREKTLLYLEQGAAEHWNELVALRVDPIYDPLRSDPRFQDLLRRVGL